ncbi:hypothetical protein [Microbispora sp. GKU 823]|uniref:hypothetical protein n=1 Tax=Microbispora sp. GKU 823 TaxID=1652100 RepID=UPI0035683D4C
MHAWADDGATTADNLHLACRHDHRARHLGGWRVTAAGPHVIVWTSPLGHPYPSPLPKITSLSPNPGPVTGPTPRPDACPPTSPEHRTRSWFHQALLRPAAADMTARPAVRRTAKPEQRPSAPTSTCRRIERHICLAPALATPVSMARFQSRTTDADTSTSTETGTGTGTKIDTGTGRMDRRDGPQGRRGRRDGPQGRRGRRDGPQGSQGSHSRHMSQRSARVAGGGTDGTGQHGSAGAGRGRHGH